MPGIVQTRFLKKFITMRPIDIPNDRESQSILLDASWFTSDGEKMTITNQGVKAFWLGVKSHGHKKVMNKYALTFQIDRHKLLTHANLSVNTEMKQESKKNDYGKIRF